jgi:hypothetical protein
VRDESNNTAWDAVRVTITNLEESSSSTEATPVPVIATLIGVIGFTLVRRQRRRRNS